MSSRDPVVTALKFLGLLLLGFISYNVWQGKHTAFGSPATTVQPEPVCPGKELLVESPSQEAEVLARSARIETNCITETLEQTQDATEVLSRIRNWAEAEPDAAGAWAQRLGDDGLRRQCLEPVAIAWAGQDLPAALHWFMHLPSDSAKDAAGLVLAYESARTDPVSAVQVLTNVDPSPERDEALAHTVSELASIDSSEASAWVSRIEDVALRSRLVATVAIAMAEVDGPAAAEMAARSVEAGDEQNRAAVAIAQRWAQRAPVEAAEWASRFPAPVRAAAEESLSLVRNDALERDHGRPPSQGEEPSAKSLGVGIDFSQGTVN